VESRQRILAERGEQDEAITSVKAAAMTGDA
jgi:hypothetical protein